MVKSGPTQQSWSPQVSLVKHRPGQHWLPQGGCLPFPHGEASTPGVVPPKSAPASSARPAVRRDPAVPKSRARRSKVWVSIYRSSAQTWGVELDVAAGSGPDLRAPTTRALSVEPRARLTSDGSLVLGRHRVVSLLLEHFACASRSYRLMRSSARVRVAGSPYRRELICAVVGGGSSQQAGVGAGVFCSLPCVSNRLDADSRRATIRPPQTRGSLPPSWSPWWRGE
jgi:hypothetical protein